MSIEPVSLSNSRQVGGDHYASEYQHWDFVVDACLGYFSAQVSRYLYRWPKKGGVQDIEKALHYIQKYLEVMDQYLVYTRTEQTVIDAAVRRFCESNRVPALESTVIQLVSTTTDKHDNGERFWRMAEALVEDLLAREKSKENIQQLRSLGAQLGVGQQADQNNAGRGLGPLAAQQATSGSGASTGYVDQDRKGVIMGGSANASGGLLITGICGGTVLAQGYTHDGGGL